MSEKIVDAGATVHVYDSIAIDDCMCRIGNKVIYAKDIYDAILDADALLVVVEWKEFHIPNWDVLKKIIKQSLVIDGRNIYEKQYLMKMEIEYTCIGK